MRDTICFSIESRVTRAAADQVEGITKPKEDQFRGDLKCGVAIERTARSLADAPPTAPFGVGYILVPGCRVDGAVRAHDEDVELVGIARDGRHRSPGRNRAGQDVPPAA